MLNGGLKRGNIDIHIYAYIYMYTYIYIYIYIQIKNMQRLELKYLHDSSTFSNSYQAARSYSSNKGRLKKETLNKARDAGHQEYVNLKNIIHYGFSCYIESQFS